MENAFIPVFKPFIGEEEKKASTNVLDIGWLGMGRNVGEFEEAVKRYIDADDRYVVAVSTGHAAIHLALLIMGVGKGDEVITPSFNNAADFQAILATGAEPVLCDIRKDDLNIDLDQVELLITKKTKAIIVMDYDCILCDHDRISRISSKYNIRILHDAAHSFGSFYKGKKIGSFSDITMFSFDPVKTITCIDGGMLVVKTKKEMYRLHEMRLVGMGQQAEVMYNNKRAWTYDIKELGFRYHMSNMHAAIGLAQLKKIKKIESTRKLACEYYNSELAHLENIRTPKTDFIGIVPFLYYILVHNGMRDELKKYLYDNGIDTGIHWLPGHCFSLLQNAKRGKLGVTDEIGKEVLSLPLHSNMDKKDLFRIVKHIKLFFHSNNNS
jgi:dTDP-4-amino-4,6-dideoxygalactose transaminase